MKILYYKPVECFRFLFFLFFLLGCNGIEDEIVPQDDIISLTILNDSGETDFESLMADGETSITLQAQIPPNADNNVNMITFGAIDSDGTAVSGFSNQGKRIII